MEMYIYKMQYADREEFSDEEYNKLLALGVIVETDYGTTEITTEILQTRVYNNEDNKEVIEILNKRVGEELVKLLLEGELDFLLVV